MKINYQIISSRSNPIIKTIASLHDKKGRDAEKTFIAEGEKLTFEAIESGLPVMHIFIREDKKDKILPRLEKVLSDKKDNDIRIFLLSEGAFDKISTEKSPQGVISAIKYLDFFLNIDIIYRKDFFILPNERVMILSSLRDPGNLGSVIRSAVAFGIDRIILSADCADVYNPKAVRSAMGSLFRVKITRVSDSVECIKALRESGRRVFAAELRDNAVSLSELNTSVSDVFIIGNEGHGIAEEISAVCDGSVYIPISKNTESLNASVAAAIFMWEQNRK